MKNSIKMFLCSLIIVPAMILLAACGETNVSVKSVSLNQNTLNVSEPVSHTLLATVLPSNATNKNVTWASSNTSVATVNNGVVTIIGEGSSIITVTTEDGDKKATCTVNYEVPYVAGVVNADGTMVKYNSFAEAISNAVSGNTIKLGANVELSEPLVLSNNLTFDGQGLYSISASDSFVNFVVVENVNKTRAMISALSSSTITNIEFKNITLNANSKARVLEIQRGKAILNNVTVTGGKVTNSNFGYAAGAYFTNSSEAELNNCKIFGNVNESYVSDSYMQYSCDLWVGANAKVTANSGTEIANVFCNANSYSSSNKGMLIVNGATITNAFLEYYENYGADLKFIDGSIANLKIATTAADGTSEVVSAIKGNIYSAGAEVSPIV